MTRTTKTSITKRPPVYSPERKMSQTRNDIGFERLNKSAENAVRKRSPDVTPFKTYNEESGSSDEESQEPSDLKECNDKVISSSVFTGISTKNLVLVIVVVIVAAAAVAFNDSNKTQQNYTISDEKVKLWENNIKKLQEQFPSQNEKLWCNFLSGVKTIETEKPVKPAVFLVLHNDKKTSACLVHKVAKEAVKFLSETPQEPIIINGEDMKKNYSLQQDYGLFAEMHKDAMKEKHVMIVLNLQEIPAVLAQTFHSLCDGENPVVNKAAYLFTMIGEENVHKNPTAMAENTLKKLWRGTLDIDILEPLITRITDTVLTLKSETNIPC